MSKTSLFLLSIFIITLIILASLHTMYGSNPVLKSFPAIFPTKPLPPSENTLTLTPKELTAPPSKTSYVQIEIDSKGEPPSVIQMELAYDPNVFSSVKLTPGTYFSNPQVLLNNVNAKNGRISYAISPGPDHPTPTSSNIVATIAIVPRINAFTRQTTLYFLPKTIVKTKTSENSLKIAYGTKITLGGGYVPLASPSARFINY